MKAKKSYGQHFLIHDTVASNIADLISTQYKNYKVLEIGPGQGKLTQFLVEKYPDLIVIEADRDMVDYLLQAYANEKLEIIHQDFLKVKLRELITHEAILIGNFPYNISSQIVFKLLEHRDLFPEMVGMFQKEVADRIIAPPGNKTYGILSVLTQAYYTGSKQMKLGPGHFNPPPKVDSAVIKLNRREKPLITSSYEDFRKIVKVAFNQRRKMLRNSLKEFIRTDSQKNHPLMNHRPEKLSVENFDELTSLLIGR